MTVFDASVVAATCFALGFLPGFVIGILSERHRDWYGNVRGDAT